MKNKGLLYGFMLILAAVLIALNICMGSVNVPFKEIIGICTGKGNDEVLRQIILNIRLPRIIATVVLGGALSLSGYMLQVFFRNSIAGPYVLGISSGAKLMVALLMVASIKLGFYASALSMVLAAFAGALLVTMVVLFISGRVRGISVLIVCGVMVGYVCSALTELLISFADDSNIANLHSWSMGSFASIQWKDIAFFSPIIVVCFLLTFILSKQIGAYSYGDNYAHSLGLKVKTFRVVLIGLSSILSATVTAFAGPISFVGIAVPHMARLLFRTDKPKVLIPAVFLGGAIFCLLSDLIARICFAPTELSISTITAIFGAPIVVAMLLDKKIKNK